MATARPPQQWLTVQDAADLLAVSTRTIRRRIDDGTIPVLDLGRGAIRINAAALELVARTPKRIGEAA